MMSWESDMVVCVQDFDVREFEHLTGKHGLETLGIPDFSYIGSTYLHHHLPLTHAIAPMLTYTHHHEVGTC